MKYSITAEVFGQSIFLEGEISRPQEARDILRELLGYDREAAVEPTPTQIVSVLGLPVVSDPAVPKDEMRLVPMLPSAGSAPVPTVDAVADAVKLVVARHGVPRAAALLKEFGGARAGDVPAENRAAFIAKAQEVTA